MDFKQRIKVIIENRDRHIMRDCLWIDGAENADTFLDLIMKAIGEYPDFSFWKQIRPFETDEEQLLTISLVRDQIKRILEYADSLDENDTNKKILKNNYTFGFLLNGEEPGTK
jgi:hypothetical protein